MYDMFFGRVSFQMWSAPTTICEYCFLCGRAFLMLPCSPTDRKSNSRKHICKCESKVYEKSTERLTKKQEMQTNWIKMGSRGLSRCRLASEPRILLQLYVFEKKKRGFCYSCTFSYKKDPQPQKVSRRFEIILGSFWSSETSKERSDFFVFFWSLLWEMFCSFRRQMNPKSRPMRHTLDHLGGTNGNVKTMLPCRREHHFWGRRGSRETSFAPLGQHFFKACILDNF